MYTKRIAIFLLILFTTLLEGRNFKVEGGFGYRRDHFVWELGSPHKKLSVLSRLTWKNLDIFELSAEVKKITSINIYMRASADLGWILQGTNRDSDFSLGKHNKIIEYSRTDNHADHGQVYDASIGVGYFFRCMGLFENLRVVPLIGWSIHGQNLRLHNGFVTIAKHSPKKEGHHVHGLDSSYDTIWNGPWGGIDLYYHCTPCISAFATFEYHWFQYHAKADWNLRSDFAGDFHHTGNGPGYFGKIGLDYSFLNGWIVGTQFKWNYAHINHGKDHTKVRINAKPGVHKSISSEGSHRHRGPLVKTETPLRKVQWNSFSLLFTVAYNF